MCTLTLAWRVFDDAPVAVAANRDEAFGRESVPPAVYRDEPLAVAPRDAEAGGTWIGYNEHGVFVGITNKWTDADLAGERSRGLLVADALAARSAAEARSIVEDATANAEYDGFYLVVADADQAVCYRWDGSLSATEFEPGVHVVVNVAVDDEVDAPSIRTDAGRDQAANARAVREVLAAGPNETAAEWLERAGAVLGDHEYGVCIHRDGFGTRSSSLIALGPETASYEFAPGPPCRTSYRPVDIAADIGSDRDIDSTADGMEVEDDRGVGGVDGEGHI
ncbi:NRDE family protein [Natrinema salifodinae]|uniref:Transport and Golgi organisation 2 n=1 Tax=Natrinema salifodinae TaxID=1202768 RepID=A0A1I0MZ44_9EURY|nr:NRDE family protein [Natrinema salifodinae]SEV93757.1 Transport and Golgi organisation 2 [Natrinema salifodinae]